MAPREDGWVTPVLTCSALERLELDTVWDQLRAHRQHLDRTGRLTEHRAAQDVRWMWSAIDDRLLSRFRTSPSRTASPRSRLAVRAGRITPTAAAEQLLASDRTEGARARHAAAELRHGGLESGVTTGAAGR